MERLEVRKISMHGFKNHEDLAEFDLGTLTKVSGGNGKGKTTIGEAITWALLGTDLVGNERATTRLVNHNCKDVYVELDFIFEAEVLNLVRRRKGSTTTIYLNDKLVKQNDLVKYYREKELLLSILNPIYFPGLAPKDAKAILESVLEEVSKEDVYEELDEKIVKTLKDTRLGNVNLYLESQRDRGREVEEELQYWNGFKEGKQEDIEIPGAVEFDKAPLEALNLKLKELSNEKVTILHDVSSSLAENMRLSKELGEINTQIDTIRKSKPSLIDVSDLETKVIRLRANYKDKAKMIRTSNNTVTCPKCETVIDMDEKVKAKVSKELEAIKVKGKVAADELKAITESNVIVGAEYEVQRKEILEGLEFEVNRLEEDIGKLDVSKLQKENEEHVKAQEDEINRRKIILMGQIIALEKEEQQAEYANKEHVDLLKRKEEVEAKVKEATENIKELEEEQLQIKLYIDYAKQFAAKRLDIQSKQINEHLDKVTIQFEKIIQSTGEIKPDFKILYDSKEFAVLSNSERIKAGLEIAKLLMIVSGLYAPIFIDNAESITEIPKMDTQLIEARVEAGKELTVEEVKTFEQELEEVIKGLEVK